MQWMRRSAVRGKWFGMSRGSVFRWIEKEELMGLSKPLLTSSARSPLMVSGSERADWRLLEVKDDLDALVETESETIDEEVDGLAVEMVLWH